jgi:hypothetical protein
MKANRAQLTGEVSEALASYMHEKTEQSITPQVDSLHIIAAHLTEMWLGRTANTPKHPKILCPFSVLVGMAVATAATKFAGNTYWTRAEEQT